MSAVMSLLQKFSGDVMIKDHLEVCNTRNLEYIITCASRTISKYTCIMSLKQERNQRTHGIMVQRLLASLIVKKCIESDKNKISFTVKNINFSFEPS